MRCLKVKTTLLKEIFGNNLLLLYLDSLSCFTHGSIHTASNFVLIIMTHTDILNTNINKQDASSFELLF